MIKGKITSIGKAFNGNLSVDVEGNIQSFEFNSQTKKIVKGVPVKNLDKFKIGDTVSIIKNGPVVVSVQVIT